MTTRISGHVVEPRGLTSLRPRTGGGDPAWLAEARRDAASWAHEHGLPTRKDEDWRYTRLEPIGQVLFQPSAARVDHDLASIASEAPGADLGGTRLIFVNGHLVPELSRLTGLPEGATVTNLATALAEDGERLRPLLSSPAGPRQHAFAALNTALAEDGAFIRLSPGTIVEEPIELVFLSDPGGTALVSSPRSVVIAERGSQVTIVETHAGIPGDQGGNSLTNAVTELVLEEEAQVEIYRVQDEPETAFQLGLLDVRQGRNSRFTSHSFALGSSIGRYEVRVRLESEGAEVSLNGLSMSRGEQQHDNPILVEHAAPHCTSRQVYKGVADGRSHSVFNGHIVVRPGAFGTDARQTNRNLLLSDRAEIDTRPRLEILTDDVKCSHGAAVGRLDEDALFYLRSRGIPDEAARGILTFAFANEMVGLIRPEPLRAWVEGLVTDRLSGGAAASREAIVR